MNNTKFLLNHIFLKYNMVYIITKKNIYRILMMLDIVDQLCHSIDNYDSLIIVSNNSSHFDSRIKIFKKYNDDNI